MSGYILYGGRFTRAAIVEMVMTEGKIDYELREIDIVNEQHRSPEFLAINPAGWVPAMVTPQGDTLYETPAISLYLAERHQLTELAPRVDEPERGAFLSGLFYIADELEPAMKRYLYPHRFSVRQEDVSAVKQQSLNMVLDRFSVIDQRLRTNGPFHLGERFSLVDLTLAYWATYLAFRGRLDAYPSIKRCLELTTQRPRLRFKLAEIHAEHEEYDQLQVKGSVAG